MQLVTIEEWSTTNFSEKSRPPEFTVRRWLRDGVVPGEKIGKTWYVDQHAWIARDDSLVAKVLAG